MTEQHATGCMCPACSAPPAAYLRPPDYVAAFHCTCGAELRLTERADGVAEIDCACGIRWALTGTYEQLERISGQPCAKVSLQSVITGYRRPA